MWRSVAIPCAVLVLCAGPVRAGAGDSITSGCRGGAGGGGFGVTVARDGEITRWHAPAFFSEPDEYPMRPDPALAARLFAELEAIGFAKTAYAKTGDMTCSLSLRAGDDVHEVSWPMGDPDAPAAVLEIARRIRELVDDPEITGEPQAEE